jgi:vitamin B12 transporter
MTRVYVCLLAIVGLSVAINAQSDTLSLPEITLTGKLLKDFSTQQNIKVFNEAQRKATPIGLVNLLQTQANMSMRENGKGGVASPSFRGTTAAQTAVVWNGININSPLVGQIDFNLLNTSDFQEIVVKSGGGSSLFGSSAIGGSLHLNTVLSQNKQSQHQLSVLGGSFDTYHANHQWVLGKNKWAFQSALSYNHSQNDYPYIGFTNKNENGQFQNLSANFSASFDWNSRLKLIYHGYLFDGFRHFSGTLSSVGKSKYKNTDSRQLLDVIYNINKNKKWQSKLALLTEQFDFYEDFNFERTSDGRAKTFLNRHEYFHQINKKMGWHAQAEYQYQWASGSQIEFANRHTAAFAAAFKHQIIDAITYDISLRFEKTDLYQAPLLYSLQAKWQPKEFYTLRVMHSKNFRAPTFNDLFWPGSGNINLKPEQSLQFDVAQDFNFNSIQLTFNYFHNQMTDMIRWLPNNQGFWRPFNTQAVEINGLEGQMKWKKNIENLFVTAELQYAYTSSVDQETAKQLIYIPRHRLTSQAQINYKNWRFMLQNMFNGAVFTNASHTDFLKEYAFTNFFLTYDFQRILPLSLQFQVMNVENQFYQNVASRPLPGRHYQLILNFKF